MEIKVLKSKYYNQRIEVEIWEILKLGYSNELVEGETLKFMYWNSCTEINMLKCNYWKYWNRDIQIRNWNIEMGLLKSTRWS